MNLRLACDNCGAQPCMCVEAECRACNGEGKVEHPALGIACTSIVQEAPHDPPLVDCEDCDGTGWIKCDGPRDGGRCKFAGPPGIPAREYHCYCEAAWERQQEDMASEPPMSADERHRQEWAEKQALRS